MLPASSEVAEVQTQDGTIPVVEIFGPTIQGEGQLAGVSTHFVRIGYCDYRCSWCDSMFAVEPDLVAKHSERLDPAQIAERLAELQEGPKWVTISGGNPAIHDLEELLDVLHHEDYSVTVETQGSYWRDWLADLELLTVSPKPPSSGMATPEREAKVHEFMLEAEAMLLHRRRCLKIVVFDQTDLAWAKQFIRRWEDWKVYLSAGTDRPRSMEFLMGDAEVRRKVCQRLKWLFDAVASDPDLADVAVLPQLHVLAWGHARGV